MKKICIIIKSCLFNSFLPSEGLRIALGLSISRSLDVSVCLIDEGVYLASYINPSDINMPESDQTFELLEASMVKIMYDADYQKEYNVNIKHKFLAPVKHKEFVDLIKSSDCTFCF